MKTSISILTLATVGLLATSALTLPALASPHRATTHTLQFTSVELKSFEPSRTQFVQSDVDVNGANQKVGFDTLNGAYDPKTKSVTLDVAIDTPDGFLYFHLHSTSSSTYTGAMTGGTGTFKHAHGSVTATNLNKSGTRTAVTVTYDG